MNFLTEMYAVADDGAGIYMSTDGGASWTLHYAGGPTFVAASWYATGNGRGFALATDGLYATISYFLADIPTIGQVPTYGPYGAGSAGGYGGLHLAGAFLGLPYGAGAVAGAPNPDWAITNPPGTALSTASIAGGPGSAGGLGWFTTRGAGGVLASVTGAAPFLSLAVNYDATNHPAGLDVGLRGATRVYYVDANGDNQACWFAAVDDDDATHARFVAGQGGNAPSGHLATPWTDAGASQAGQLGASYAPSDDGVAALADDLY
jgi:hypothetical protein